MPSTRWRAGKSRQGFEPRVWNASSGKISSARTRPPPMTHYQRKQRRRQNGGKARNAIFVGAGVLLAVVGIGVASVVGYVISIYATGPSIDELKPVDKGATSAIYAANG